VFHRAPAPTRASDFDQAREVPSIYCPTCNERFHIATTGAGCPRCGARIDASPGDLAETLYFKNAPPTPQAVSIPVEAAQPPDPLIGDRLHVYRCEALLGWGAMGRVYLAHHQDLDRKCALKVLSPRICQIDVDYVERFQREGRTAAGLVHPNVVTTHAIGESRGYRFLEMEFVPGRSLQHLIEEQRRIEPERAMALAVRIADGLAYAHRRGIVHRDLKPDNVLISVLGIPKIADFGLAKRVLPCDTEDADCLVGTPHYMAPELFDGEPSSQASDVYALGVCLYVMLTGTVPHPCGSLGELVARLRDEPPPDLRARHGDIPLEVAECVGLFMAKAPANRPQDATAALQLLSAVAADVPDIETLLATAFDGQSNVTWKREADEVRVAVRLPDGRRQTVHVRASEHAVADRLLLLYSLCGPARPQFFEQGLRLNAEMAHGSLAIREIAGIPQFVMIDTYPRATVDAEELRRSILELAAKADAMEKLLGGGDRY
jgi:serine/threonine-protein kinase